MQEKLTKLLEILLSPAYEEAVTFLLVMHHTEQAFKAACVPLANDPFIELAKESIGKAVFKNPKPTFGGQEFMEYPAAGLVHGAMILEGCNVVLLFFREQGIGVAAIYRPTGKCEYLRITKLAEEDKAFATGAFVPNDGTVN
jgi:hypothetical protein